MTPQQFKQSWERVAGDRLVAFPEHVLADVRLSADARAFLVEAGLPEDAAPMLNFGPPEAGTLKRASVASRRPAAFDRYRIVGFNGSGDPVCIDEEADGAIVELNHDDDFRRNLMASSATALAECLLLVRDAIADAGGDADVIEPARVAELLQRLRAVDPAACGADGYWTQEIPDVFPTAGLKPRKFWSWLWK